MSDGKIIFETLLDESGLLKGLDDVEATASQKLGVVGSAFEKTGGIMTKAFNRSYRSGRNSFPGDSRSNERVPH